MKLSELSPINEEQNLYETVEADHVYDIPGVLDKHNQVAVYEEVQAPSQKPEPSQMQPLSSTSDFELTQCPAYVSVATTSIHDNASK